jgi:hypothetical protein
VAKPPTADDSTILTRQGEDLEEGSNRASLWLRRAMLAAMALLVAADLLSLLGVHTSSISATHDGYTVTLHYPSVARAGLDTPWQVTVSHPGGFGPELTLAITGSYFNIFETQGFHPNPSDETRDGTTLYLTFTAPPGNTFVVDFDTYVQPASQQGRSATLTVIDGGAAKVSVDYHTRLMP